MFAGLHRRLGEFWWNSLLLFCACRAADAVNAFVGIWLVPKYINTAELGAVLPLTSFAVFLSIPAMAFANTFRNEVSRLVQEREFGRLKSLMSGVFIAMVVFLLVALLFSRFVLPFFLGRIRIAKGSLGSIIAFSAIVGAVSPVFSGALQALKKFKAHSFLSAVGAPVRLITMLVAMPFRALSGYFVGQAACPLFTIVGDIYCLRKELSIPGESYWKRGVCRRFALLFAIFLAWGFTGGMSGLVELTIIRQRLPDLDSAGYYMATRFSEISLFLCYSILFTIFPYTAEMSAKGQDERPLVFKSIMASFAFAAVVALPFVAFGRPLLALLPGGGQYASYWWVIPWSIGILSLNFPTMLYTTAQVSGNRFSFLKWLMPIDVAYPVAILMFGEISSLKTMLVWMTAANFLKGSCSTIALIRQRRAS